MIKKLKGNKKLKVIFIILVITFIYFISQKIIIKTYDNTYKLSLYETSSIKLYLKIKYPLKAFKILYVTNEERFSIENGNISDGILTNKIILVGVKNKPGNEFQIGITYILNPISYLISGIKEITTAFKYSNSDRYVEYNPFYFGILLKDDYKYKNKAKEITIESELENEVNNIIKKYLKNKEFKILIKIINNEYNNYLLADLNIKTLKDFINMVQMEDNYFDLKISVIINEENYYLNDNSKIKEYCEISKKILNDLENNLKNKVELKKFSFKIDFMKMNNTNFQKIKSLPNSTLNYFGFAEISKGYGSYSITKDYNISYYNETLYGDFKNILKNK